MVWVWATLGLMPTRLIYQAVRLRCKAKKCLTIRPIAISWQPRLKTTWQTGLLTSSLTRDKLIRKRDSMRTQLIWLAASISTKQPHMSLVMKYPIAESKKRTSQKHQRPKSCNFRPTAQSSQPVTRINRSSFGTMTIV